MVKVLGTLLNVGLIIMIMAIMMWNYRIIAISLYDIKTMHRETIIFRLN